MLLPCPACGFLTIEENCYGTYLICPICDWEDDPVQLANPACGGGANTQSLIEVQRTVLSEHSVSTKIAAEFERDSDWRPLNTRECETAEVEKRTKYWMNKAIYDPARAYWHRQE